MLTCRYLKNTKKKKKERLKHINSWPVKPTRSLYNSNGVFNNTGVGGGLQIVMPTYKQFRFGPFFPDHYVPDTPFLQKKKKKVIHNAPVVVRWSLATAECSATKTKTLEKKNRSGSRSSVFAMKEWHTHKWNVQI